MAGRDPAELVVLFGPPAVGKTTVGRKLAALIPFRLFHGHMTMDVLTELFEYGSPAFMRLHRLITFQILEQAAAGGQSLIFTTGWRFDQPTDTAFNVAVGESFLAHGGCVHYVELWAPLATRIERNGTAERKATKKTDWATDAHLEAMERLEIRNSGGELPLGIPFLRLETASMSADATAEAIRAYIGHGSR